MTHFLLAKMSAFDIVWMVVASVFALIFAIAIIINLAEYTQSGSGSGSIRRISVGIVGIFFLLIGYFTQLSWFNLPGIFCLLLGFADAIISVFRKQTPTKKSKEQIEGMKFK